jgi:DNA-binding GntR family transcriptional regulator
MASKNLSGEIYNTLTTRINTWVYPPGHRLTEEDLSAEFQVSRSPVREALNMLVEASLIEKEERKGYRVRKMSLKEINDLYDTRKMLEQAVIDRVCVNVIDPEILDDLERRWKNILKSLPAMASEAALEDEKFHETLAQVAGNRVIQRILKDIDLQIHFVRLSDITDPDRLKKTCEDHLAILDALRQRDRERAKKIIRDNIEWGREKVAAALKDALARAHGIF